MSLDEIVSSDPGYGRGESSFGKAGGKSKSRSARVAPYEGTDEASGDNCRVYVGNLPYSASWQDLKDHMRAAGKVVDCDILAQPGTACGSKGCGIVEFATAREARRAVAELQDTHVKGRPIFVREDREEGGHYHRKGDSKGVLRKGDSKGGQRRDSGGSRGGCNVFVGNLSYSVTWQNLKDHMRAAGDVVHCDIIPEKGTTLGSKGCGMVQYSTAAEAQRAIRKMTETELNGRTIYCREDREEDGTSEKGRGKGRGKGGGRDRSRDRSRDRGGGGGAGCRVFVGNLAYSVDWKSLKDHMRTSGLEVVHCDVMTAPGTTMGSKGCGLVEFATARDARYAIKDLNDTVLQGRAIWLREDREEDMGRHRR